MSTNVHRASGPGATKIYISLREKVKGEKNHDDEKLHRVAIATTIYLMIIISHTY